MKRIAVLSGKGGTGKTTVVSSLAARLGTVMLVDCDVDAANLAVLLSGDEEPAFTLMSGHDVSIDAEACIGCGACAESCRFDAVELHEGKATISAIRCEGCNTCSLVCPSDAIRQSPRRAGTAWVRQTAVGALIHAHLATAQDNSGHIVAHLLDLASRVAQQLSPQWILLDGPPGLGCPVQATLAGADGVLVVAEPSPSSGADLERLLVLLARLSLPAAVIVNRCDAREHAGPVIPSVCDRFGVPLVSRLPFDTAVPQALARGKVPGTEVEALRRGLDGSIAWLHGRWQAPPDARNGAQ